EIPELVLKSLPLRPASDQAHVPGLDIEKPTHDLEIQVVRMRHHYRVRPPSVPASRFEKTFPVRESASALGKLLGAEPLRARIHHADAERRACQSARDRLPHVSGTEKVKLGAASDGLEPQLHAAPAALPRTGTKRIHHRARPHAFENLPRV